MSNIILGTAQFGEKYGLSQSNRMSLNLIRKIVSFAAKNKIKFIDTAPFYGNAEKKLGKCSLKKFKIISKVKLPKKINHETLVKVHETIVNSYKDLKNKSIYGILIHNPKVMKNYKANELKALIETFNFLKKKKIFKHVGISIYHKNEILKSYDMFPIKILQAPYNIFDRRFTHKRFLNYCKKKKITLIGRSIFLQGLLINERYQNKPFFKKKSYILKRYFNYLKKIQSSGLNACLNFALTNKIKSFVIGIDNLNQLKEILNFKRKKINFPKFFDERKQSDLILPINWNLKI